MKTKKNGNGNGKKNNNNDNLCANKKLFIKLYPVYGTVGATLKAMGIKHRWTFYHWTAADPKFKELYETELLPNRRDELVSIVYQAATGKVTIDKTQLTAAFGMLKATDHSDDPKSPDRLIFIDRNQLEVGNKDNKPLRIVYELVKPDDNRVES